MPVIGAVPWLKGQTIVTDLQGGGDRNGALDIRDMVQDEYGVWQLRGGIASYMRRAGEATERSVGSADEIIAIGTHKFDNYTELYIGAANLWYGLNASAWTEDLSNGSLITAPVSTTIFQDYLLITSLRDHNDLRTVYAWLGGNKYLLPILSAPRFTITSQHYRRVIAAGLTNQPLVWHASMVDDPFDWDTNAALEAGVDGAAYKAEIPTGNRITAISPSHYGAFYIVTDEGLHKITGTSPSEYTYSFIDGTVRNIGHRTIVNVEGNLLGWNTESCYIISDTDRSGQVDARDIGKDIRTAFNTYCSKDPMDYFSIVDPTKDLYITFMPARLEDLSTIALCFNYRTGAWSWWAFEIPIHSASMVTIGNQSELLLGGPEGVILRLLSNTKDELVKYPSTSGIRPKPFIQSHKLPINDDDDVTVRELNLWLVCKDRHDITVTIYVYSKNNGSTVENSYTINVANQIKAKYLADDSSGTFDPTVDILRGTHDATKVTIGCGGIGTHAWFKIESVGTAYEESEAYSDFGIYGYEFVVEEESS